MSMSLDVATLRLTRAVPEAETDLDQAMLSVSKLMTSMIEARQGTDVPKATGQASLIRLARAQNNMISASSDVLRIHSDLLKLGNVYGAMDIHDCPPSQGALTEVIDDRARA